MVRISPSQRGIKGEAHVRLVCGDEIDSHKFDYRNYIQMYEAPQDGILEDFIKAVEETFPDIPIVNSGYGIDFHLGFGIDNYPLRKSKYYFDSSHHTFFHLTSYRNFFSIINSGVIRLYNLFNSDDANELNAYLELGVPQHEIDYAKKSIFTFSFSDIENKELWEAYGKVALVFEIVNSPASWTRFHLAEISYETNPAFRRFYEIKEHFEKRYGFAFRNDTLKNLIAFHKINRLKWEREVRLMCIPDPYNPKECYSDFKTSEHHTGHTKYIDLGLFVESGPRFSTYLTNKLPNTFDSVYYADKPMIKIKAIKFGDNETLINQEKFDEIHFEIAHYVQERFGYQIHVDKELFKTGVTKKS